MFIRTDSLQKIFIKDFITNARYRLIDKFIWLNQKKKYFLNSLNWHFYDNFSYKDIFFNIILIAT